MTQFFERSFAVSYKTNTFSPNDTGIIPCYLTKLVENFCYTKACTCMFCS